MFPVLIGIVILSISGIFFNQVNKPKEVKGVSTQVEINSNTDNESSPSADPSESPSTLIKTGSTNTNVEIKNNVNTSTSNNSNSDNTGSNTSLDLDSLKYPNSSITSKNGNSLELTSSDDPEKITEWYKDKIRSLGMNTKSFVTTKSNDNVLNKLAGSDGKHDVSVEIKKDSGLSISNIKITVTSL